MESRLEELNVFLRKVFARREEMHLDTYDENVFIIARGLIYPYTRFFLYSPHDLISPNKRLQFELNDGLACSAKQIMKQIINYCFEKIDGRVGNVFHCKKDLDKLKLKIIKRYERDIEEVANQCIV